MKKIFHYFVLAFVTVLLGSQLFLYADSAGIRVKPTHIELNGTVEYQPSYASLNFYTSIPTFFNLSTTAFQIVKPWSTKASFTNISCDAANGLIKFKTDSHGTYKIAMRTSNKYTEGATVYFQTVRNYTSIVNKTFKQATQGPERNPILMNMSTTGSGATADIINSSTSTTFGTLFTNTTSNAKAVVAISNADGKYYMVNEGGTGTVRGFVVRATFGSIDTPKYLHIINSGYDGGGHHVKLRAYNAVLGRYTALTDGGSDYSDVGSLPSGTSPLWERKILFPVPYKNYVNSSKQTRIIFDHTDAGSSTHNFMMDKIAVQDALSSFYVEHTEIVSINDGDVLQMRIRTDTPGTDFYRYVSGLKIDKIGN